MAQIAPTMFWRLEGRATRRYNRKTTSPGPKPTFDGELFAG